MAYYDEYQLAKDDRDKFIQQIAASMNQEQPAPELVQQVVAAQQGQATQQPMPAPNNGLAATTAQFTPLTPAERMIYGQIYNMKKGYGDAEQAGDMAAAQKFNAAANDLRGYAEKYGMDTSRIGSDVSRDQLGMLLQADYAKAMDDVGNMLTPREYYAQSMENYRAQGVSDSKAANLALADLKRYEGEYARKLAVAMDAYGLNADGSMNQHSGLIQTLAYLNNPMGAAIYDRYYANPKEQWAYDKTLESMGYANGLKMDAAKQNFGFTRALNNDRYAFQSGENEANRQHQMTMLALKAQIDAKTEADRRAWIESNPELAGILGYGGRGSRGTRGNGDEITEKDMINIQNAQDIYRSGLSLVGEDIDNAIAELDKMKTKEADSDTRKRLEGMKYALQARREAVAWNDGGQKGGYDNFLNYYQWAVDNNAYDLVKDLEEVYNDARREKEKAEKAAEPKETPKQQPRDIPKGYWPEYKIGGAYGINRPY